MAEWMARIASSTHVVCDWLISVCAYEYDFIDGWQHDVRVEQTLPFEHVGRVCMRNGARRATPR